MQKSPRIQGHAAAEMQISWAAANVVTKTRSNPDLQVASKFFQRRGKLSAKLKNPDIPVLLVAKSRFFRHILS